MVVAQVFLLPYPGLALTCSCFEVKEPGGTKGIKGVALSLEEL